MGLAVQDGHLMAELSRRHSHRRYCPCVTLIAVTVEYGRREMWREMWRDMWREMWRDCPGEAMSDGGDETGQERQKRVAVTVRELS